MNEFKTEMNEFKTDLGIPKFAFNQSKYRKYTIYGRFNSDICSTRCKNIQPNKLLQKMLLLKAVNLSI